MKLRAMKFAVAATVFGAGLAVAPSAHAGGYYYAPVSYYVAPPVVPAYGYYSVFDPLPVTVYRPVVAAPAVVAPVVASPVVVTPAPVVGYYAPISAAPVRVYERTVGTPYRSRTRVDVIDPYGPNYHLRSRQVGGYVTYRERWGW